MKKLVIIVSALLFGFLLNSCDGQTAKASSTVTSKPKTETITKSDSSKVIIKDKQEILYKNLENTSAELKKQQHKLDSLLRKK